MVEKKAGVGIQGDVVTVVQLLSCVPLFGTPWTAAGQGEVENRKSRMTEL